MKRCDVTDYELAIFEINTGTTPCIVFGGCDECPFCKDEQDGQHEEM